MWANYARAAAECGELGSACRAVVKVVRLSHGEEGDIAVVQHIVDAVEEGVRKGFRTSLEQLRGGGGGDTQSVGAVKGMGKKDRQ